MWAHDLLGIAPDADERTVKRAYAARLKVTRPDEDPVAFQRLVEARDRALDWARAGYGRPRAGPDDADDVEPVGTPRSTMPATAGGAASEPDAPGARPSGPEPASATQAEAGPVEETIGSVLSRRETPEPGPDTPVRPPDPPPWHVQDVFARFWEDDDAPEPDGAPDAEDRRPPGRTEGPGGFGDAAPDGRADAELAARADRLLAADGPADIEAWRRFLADVEELDLGRRLVLETRLATGLDRALGRTDIPEEARAAALAPVLAEVGPVFGWTRDVRRLARLIGEDAEIRPLLLAIEVLAAPPPPERRDPTGFPLIEPFDLEAYYGAPDRRMPTYYRRALAAGRLVASWSWSAFLSPPWWAARRGFGAAALFGTFGAIAAVAAAADAARAGDGAAFYAVLAGLLAARVTLAATANRLELLRFARLVDRADREVPARNERRRAFLAGRNPGARVLPLVLATVFFVWVDLTVALVLDRLLPPAPPRSSAATVDAPPARR